ncbi:uncharacterized protein A4U43_C07F4590 [Asparagus officinalis]|uniref:Uncharacterized protein n=1 Tax=Asparagus officinalis TaxID=4686 RepID=A0A5P1E9H1_ASPOF|nr:uncharacterized protein A4U43_C07F4590 [Asparagus officinalis]
MEAREERELRLKSALLFLKLFRSRACFASFNGDFTAVAEFTFVNPWRERSPNAPQGNFVTLKGAEVLRQQRARGLRMRIAHKLVLEATRGRFVAVSSSSHRELCRRRRILDFEAEGEIRGLGRPTRVATEALRIFEKTLHWPELAGDRVWLEPQEVVDLFKSVDIRSLPKGSRIMLQNENSSVTRIKKRKFHLRRLMRETHHDLYVFFGRRRANNGGGGGK